MADQHWEAPLVTRGEQRLRTSQAPGSNMLGRRLKLSLALFVLFVVLGAGQSLLAIRTLGNNQQTLAVASRLDQHLERLTERARHYDRIAPRNYADFGRDVQLYYATLREDIDVAEALVADLARRDPGFDADLWNNFRNGLDEQIGFEADRPRLEWAAEFIVAESGPLRAAAEQARAEIRAHAEQTRNRLWITGIALALVTLALAIITAWLFRKQVLNRIGATSIAVRHMADGRFDNIRRRRADDELGQLESDVAQMARRTVDLVQVLDSLNGAHSLSDAIERMPSRLKRQFGIEWLGVVEVHERRMRIRASLPGVTQMGIEQPATGWALDNTLLAKARDSGHAEFEMLRNADGELGVPDPLLRQLRGMRLVSAALLPVRGNGDAIEAGVLVASRYPDAFSGWRGRWLVNVGHLIADAIYKALHVEQLGISLVRGLAELAEKRDPTTGRHLERMQRYAGILARELVARGKVDTERHPRFAERIEVLAPLHDIGKVGISDFILLKPGALTQQEREEIKNHPKIGADVLMVTGESLGFAAEPMFAHAMDIALYHHEKYDGSGYPHGLVGEAIPLSARIVALADVWDALTSERPYKQAWSEDDALAYIKRERGRHFDPELVDAFVARFDEVRRIRKIFSDTPELQKSGS